MDNYELTTELTKLLCHSIVDGVHVITTALEDAACYYDTDPETDAYLEGLIKKLKE